MKNQEDNQIYHDLKQSLQEAIDYKKGKIKAKVHRRRVNVAPLPHYSPSDIKRIREELNLSQRTFADVLGVSVKSIEAWEAGRTEPNGSAQRILSIIEHDRESLEKYELVEIS
jgi:putative transcriptional regulator